MDSFAEALPSSICSPDTLLHFYAVTPRFWPPMLLSLFPDCHYCHPFALAPPRITFPKETRSCSLWRSFMVWWSSPGVLTDLPLGPSTLLVLQIGLSLGLDLTVQMPSELGTAPAPAETLLPIFVPRYAIYTSGLRSCLSAHRTMRDRILTLCFLVLCTSSSSCRRHKCLFE